MTFMKVSVVKASLFQRISTRENRKFSNARVGDIFYYKSATLIMLDKEIGQIYKLLNVPNPCKDVLFETIQPWRMLIFDPLFRSKYFHLLLTLLSCWFGY